MGRKAQSAKPLTILFAGALLYSAAGLSIHSTIAAQLIELEGLLQWQRRSRPVIGLDITTSSIKLIELSRSGDGYRVESYSLTPSPPNAINEKAIVDAQAVGEAGAPRREARRRAQQECAVAISDAAIAKIIQMPRNLREAELSSRRSRCRPTVHPFPMEEGELRLKLIGPIEKDPDMLDVLLVATRSENVEQRQSSVQSAGLTARIVDVEAFALRERLPPTRCRTAAWTATSRSWTSARAAPRSPRA